MLTACTEKNTQTIWAQPPACGACCLPNLSNRKRWLYANAAASAVSMKKRENKVRASPRHRFFFGCAACVFRTVNALPFVGAEVI
jgi:hypothetical protein